MSETEQVRTEIEDIRARSDDLADVFDGVSEGVPMVGNVGKTRSENEVFIPDTLHCTVLVKTTDATYMGGHSNGSTGLASILRKLPSRKGRRWNFPTVRRTIPYRAISSTPSVRSRRPTVPTVWNSYCDACRRGRPGGTGHRRGAQGILEQGETSDGPKGIRKTQTAIQRPPIGRSATRPIKMSPLPPSETVRTIGGDGQNKNTTTKGEKTWPKPHRP